MFVVLCLGSAPAVAKTTEILAFGDSLTSGFGLPPAEALPTRLETKLREDGLAVHVGSHDKRALWQQKSAWHESESGGTDLERAKLLS